MTTRELSEVLSKHLDTPLSIVFRLKTGYDEGDIYEGDLEVDIIRDNVVRVQMANPKCVGGW